MARITSSPIGSGSQPWSCSQMKSNSGSAAEWHDEQLPPKRLTTSAPPRVRIFVPAGDTSSEKNSQSSDGGVEARSPLDHRLLGHELD